MSATREVYLLSFSVAGPSRLNHWVLYFPHPLYENMGKTLDVIGSPSTSYKCEIKHYWDMTKTREKYTMHLLGETNVASIADAELLPARRPDQFSTQAFYQLLVFSQKI